MIRDKVKMFGNEEVKSWVQALFLGLFYSILVYVFLGVIVFAIGYLMSLFGNQITLLIMVFVGLVMALTFVVKDNDDNKDTQELTDEHPPL